RAAAGQLHRPLERRDGLIEAFEQEQGQAEVEMNLGEVGIELEGPLEALDRLVGLIEKMIDPPPPGHDDQRERVELESLVHLLQSFIEAAAHRQVEGVPMPGRYGVGVQLDG